MNEKGPNIINWQITAVQSYDEITELCNTKFIVKLSILLKIKFIYYLKACFEGFLSQNVIHAQRKLN